MKTMPRSRASVLALSLTLLASCLGRDKEADKDDSFRTSGSREADQRAEQRISKEEQLRGEGDGGDKAKPNKRTLYERLGSQAGVEQIVGDFVDRAIADPRTNWERLGVKRGSVLGIGGKSAEWKPTEENLVALKLHLAQFIAVATGGPVEYEGRGIGAVHHGMKVTNAEFDASIGALKASLDALKVSIDEQKELLAVFESTRPQIAEKR
jgi:hemoglobin